MNRILIALVVGATVLSAPAAALALTPIVKEGSIFEKLKCGKGVQFNWKTRKCAAPATLKS